MDPALRRFAALLAAVLSACEPAPGPRMPPPDPPGGPPADLESAPILLEYVCGNRFVLVNQLPQAVTVRWEVRGTEERGERRLAPAQAGDPPFSETELTVLNENPVALYHGDSLIAVAANVQTPCEPIVDGPSFAVAAGSAAGAWSAPSPWPVVALHLHLLRTGKVLAWGKFGDPYL
ncbi:MAG: hypothetical protein L0214_11940, partial [candidate division NC10 bacterium]|nr:hypothetical protein [candidate division NC10 bacterium]